MRHPLLCAGFAGLLLMCACASQPAPTPAKQASTYFLEGETLFEKGLYQDAIASWEKVRESYYSPELNILAELKIAEAYYADERYLEAVAAYEAFLKNHPGHAKTQDVLYHLGLANMKQMLDRDQDQTITRQTLITFQSLLQRYPQDPRKEEILSYIDHCLYRLAAHEMVVGQYYLKAGKYQAAINRFERILKEYPGRYDIAEVYYHLGQAYLLIGDRDKSGEAFTFLFNQYPNSEYIKAAEKFIRKHN